MLVVRMATGIDPESLSYRRFSYVLSKCRDVKDWIDGKGELPELCPAPKVDLEELGLV